MNAWSPVYRNHHGLVTPLLCVPSVITYCWCPAPRPRFIFRSWGSRPNQRSLAKSLPRRAVLVNPREIRAVLRSTRRLTRYLLLPVVCSSNLCHTVFAPQNYLRRFWQRLFFLSFSTQLALGNPAGHLVGPPVLPSKCKILVHVLLFMIFSPPSLVCVYDTGWRRSVGG